ncbi:MAG TPA: NUDIX domain-containing protein [Longimicrobium sp.]|jgi:hypothetical protein
MSDSAEKKPAPPDDGPVPEWALRYDASEFPRFAVTGDAVAFALDRDGGEAALQVLVVVRDAEPFRGLDAFPGGFMDWEADPTTRETAVRELAEETGVDAPEYVEPLGSYTQHGRDPRQFAGRRDERTGEWVPRGVRVATNAYLVLMRRPSSAPTAQEGEVSEARWTDVYAYLPWEDLRAEAGRAAARRALAGLSAWAEAAGGDARERIDYAFGFGLKEWNEERVGDRWRLLFDAGLVPEGRRDAWGRAEAGETDAAPGREMAFDHRRILGDALARLRGKIKYLPASLMALTGEDFTLDELQSACEAIAGRPLHRANFRRTVAAARDERQTRTPRIVSGTGRRRKRAAGEPGVAPELFRFRPDAVRARLDPSLRLPFLGVAAGPEEGSP